MEERLRLIIGTLVVLGALMVSTQAAPVFSKFAGAERGVPPQSNWFGKAAGGGGIVAGGGIVGLLALGPLLSESVIDLMLGLESPPQDDRPRLDGQHYR